MRADRNLHPFHHYVHGVVMVAAPGVTMLPAVIRSRFGPWTRGRDRVQSEAMFAFRTKSTRWVCP